MQFCTTSSSWPSLQVRRALSSVQCGDLACDRTRHQKAEDLSDEMPLRHPRTDPVGHALEYEQPEGSRRATCGGATEAHETAMARPCGTDARPPPPEATPQVPPTVERRTGGASLWWIDVISRDLEGMTNWQETHGELS